MAKCEYCGKEWTPLSGWRPKPQRFCSRACANRIAAKNRGKNNTETKAQVLARLKRSVPVQLCKCGCGKRIPLTSKYGNAIKYAPGHQPNFGLYLKTIEKEVPEHKMPLSNNQTNLPEDDGN